MKILSIDTSGPYAGVALMEDGIITHEISACHGLTHSESSMPMVDQALSDAHLTPADIDLFAAVTGPGSFTGVRIGVCAVKGLAHATGRGVVGVDALEALAEGIYEFDGLLCPILDARRQQVYAAAFHKRAGLPPERILPDEALPLTAFLKKLPDNERLLFLGDGLTAHMPAIRQVLGARASEAPAHLSFIRAASVCSIAARMAAQALPPMELMPLYLRAPQAERERAERESKNA